MTEPEGRAGEATGRLLARIGVATGIAFVLVALAVEVGGSRVTAFDERWSGNAYRFGVSHHWCELLARAATWMGNTLTLTVITAAVVVACLVTKRSTLALWLAATVAGSASLNSLVKLAMERLRPGSAGVLTSARGFAFPSGHTQGATSTYVAVVLVVGWQVYQPGSLARKVSAAATTTLIAAVGFSRVILGAHWPTDVLGAWLLGSTCVLAATAILLYLERPRPALELSPA